MKTLFDTLQSQSQEQREQRKMAAFRELAQYASSKTEYYKKQFTGIDISKIKHYEDLQQVPVLVKSELTNLQAKFPPLGGLVPQEKLHQARYFFSPGNICEIYLDGGDRISIARALHTAGFVADDIVQNCFSYHLTPAAYMFESGALSLGCHVIPAGVGQTEQQAMAMSHYQSTAYIGTPDYLMKLLEKADELALNVKSLKKAMVTAGPLFPSLREAYQKRGVDVRQCYATAELDIIAYEQEIDNGLYINEEVIVEIVHPGTGEHVMPGQVGEVMVTKLSTEYPLIRMATGDLSMFLPNDSLGNDSDVISATKIKGWMGRADQSTKVKGQFVRPEQMAELCKRMGFHKARAVVNANDKFEDILHIYCEYDDAQNDDNNIGKDNESLIDKAKSAIRDITKLKAEVEINTIGSLPNDGIVIEDKRDINKT